MAEDSRATTPGASVWQHDRPAVARRSRQPAGLDRDKIVATAVRLLDAEGLATFSMRKLAAELGVTAMSVYWYVDTKDDLLERVLDAVHGEIVLPAEEPDGDWRDEVRQLALGYRTMLVDHPWTGHLIGAYPNIGPRSMECSEIAMRAVARSGLAAEQLTGALGCVVHYVHGHAAAGGRWGERFRTGGPDEEDVSAEWAGGIGDHASVTVAQRREGDFAFGLDCVIAGIETMRDRNVMT